MMKNIKLIIILLVLIGFNSYAQKPTIKTRQFKTFAQKGTKLFVKCNCWDDDQFKQVFLIELGGKGIWRIVNNALEADFVLDVNAWSRPQIAGFVNEAYILVYDNEDHLLYKSDLYIGQPTVVNGYDSRKALIKNLIHNGLLTEIPKSEWLYSEPLDLLGSSKIAEEKYKESMVLFWQGIDYFNQYNYKEAIKLFTKVLSLNPYNSFTYECRAIAFCNLSMYKDARKDILAAMKLDPYNKQNDSTYYSIMIGRNDKFMRTYGPGGTMDKISSGLQSINQSITLINQTNVGTTPPKNTTIVETPAKSNTNKGHLEKVTCTYCKGTGISPYPSQGTCFGIESDHWCDVCHKTVPCSHGPHLNCLNCKGTGYVEKFVH